MKQGTAPVAKHTHGLNIDRIREGFPMLKQQYNGKQLIYLDSAATSQKPRVVIERLQQYYLTEYGKPKEEHTPGKITTEAMEEARAKTAKMMGAAKPEEVIFTKGCTESINIVAHGFSDAILQPGDEIIITQFEHHANIVPWQIACKRTGAVLKVAPFSNTHELDMQQLEDMITGKTRIISLTHSSHVLGSILPVKEVAKMAHKKGIAVMVDGAQAAPHMPIDMGELDCDFYTFSGHKMGSPSGVGVLYGKKKWLDKIAPLMGGGEMASKVSFESSSFAEIPTKFEGGTQPFAEIIAFGALMDYLEDLGMDNTSKYEQSLLHYTEHKLSQVDRIKVYGEAEEKEPVLSFDIKGADVKDLEKYLNSEWSIAVRAGELTAQPLMKLLGVKGLLRVSFCYYNTYNEADILVNAIEEFLDNNKR